MSSPFHEIEDDRIEPCAEVDAIHGHIDFGGIRFGVVAESAQVVDELAALGFVETSATVPTSPDSARERLVNGPTFRIRMVDNGFRTTVVELDKSDDYAKPEVATGESSIDVEPPLRYNASVPHGGTFSTVSGAVHGALSVMTERVVRTEPDWLHLHAGAVDVHGAGVVIPAKSGTGKTTLVAELGRLGGVLTDELVAVDRVAGVIRATERPLSVKSTNFARFAKTHPSLTPQRVGEFVWHVTIDSIGLSHVAWTEPRLIAIPNRRAGRVQVTEIDPCEALLALVDHSYDLDVDPVRAFDDLVWLVDTCHCVRFDYEEASDVAGPLANWLGAHPVAASHHAVRVDGGQDDDRVLAVRFGTGEVQWNTVSREVLWLDVGDHS